MRKKDRTAANLIAATVMAILTVAGSSSQSSTASSPPPKDAAKIGVPFLVHDGSASVEVTLIKITYATTRPDGTPANAGEYALLHLRIVGKSAHPFKVYLEDFYDQYTQQPDPYQPEDTNIYGVDPTDWSEFPQRLPITSVTNGKEVSGAVPLDVSLQSILLISMAGSDGVTPIAQWLTTSH